MDGKVPHLTLMQDAAICFMSYLTVNSNLVLPKKIIFSIHFYQKICYILKTFNAIQGLCIIIQYGFSVVIELVFV